MKYVCNTNFHLSKMIKLFQSEGRMMDSRSRCTAHCIYACHTDVQYTFFESSKVQPDNLRHQLYNLFKHTFNKPTTW